MPLNNHIIPRRYPPLAVKFEVDPALEKKHTLAYILALNYLGPYLQTLLEKPTDQALLVLSPLIARDEGLKPIILEHVRNFPRKYSIPPEMATAFLLDTYNRALQQQAAARAQGIPFNMQAPGAVMISLLRVGANPFFVLCRPETTPEDIDAFLSQSPRTATKDYRGHTLAHTHSFKENFADKYLPILLKHKLDINKTSEVIPSGTFMHEILANEGFESALKVIEKAKHVLDLSRRDGMRQTIPILAARVRAESVLLALAENFPRQKLALDAQDAEDRTVMHYCFALGLIQAARRYIDLGASLEKQDKQGRKPADYLNLTSDETLEMLRSIEIHPDRDIGAWRNAIIGIRVGMVAVHLAGEPILAIRGNFTHEIEAAAFAEYGESGLKLVRAQANAMKGKSVLEDVLDKRVALKSEFDNGLLAPQTAGRAVGASNPKTEPK